VKPHRGHRAVAGETVLLWGGIDHQKFRAVLASDIDYKGHLHYPVMGKRKFRPIGSYDTLPVAGSTRVHEAEYMPIDCRVFVDAKLLKRFEKRGV